MDRIPALSLTARFGLLSAALAAAIWLLLTTVPFHDVAEGAARDTRRPGLLLAGGLGVLWLGLFRLVSRASRRLQQAAARSEAEARKQRRLAEELAEQQAALRIHSAVVEATQESVIVTSPDGTIADWNPGAERLYGYTREQALGMSVAELYVRGSQLFGELMETALASGHASFDEPALLRDGSQIRVAGSISLIRDEAGDVTGIVGISRNVTDQARLLEQLKESERRLTEAQRLAGVGSWSWDVAANLLVWSDEHYRLFGIAPQEFEATYEAFLAHVHPDDRQTIERVVEAMFNGSAHDFEVDYRGVRPDGQLLWLRGRGQAEHDEQGNLVRVFGTAQDITASREAERQLRVQRDRLAVLAAVVDSAHDAVIVTSPDGTIVAWNPGAERLYGYTSEEAIGQHVSLVMSLGQAERIDQIMGAIGTRGHARIESEDVHKDGSPLTTSVTVSQVRDAAGTVTALIGIARDITQEKLAERQLRVQRDRLAVLAAVVEATDDAIIVTSPDGTIVAWNPGAERLYGYTSEEVIGRHVTLVMSSDGAERFPKTIAAVEARGHTRIESDDMHKDGSRLVTSVTVSQVCDDDGRTTALIGIARDITEEKRALEREREHAGELAHQAFHDPLTGLANRARLNDRLAHALVGRRRDSVSVLLLDLDDFKSVNDVSGHTAGDRLLIEVARRLRDCARPEDTVARLGGDEFAIMLEQGDPGALATRVLSELAVPVDVEARQVVPLASIGIASGEGRVGPEELIVRADIAMYAAKANGKGQVEHFSPAMAAAVRERADLRDALRQAVAGGEIRVHHQPIINVDAQSVSRMEALVRWQRPEEIVPPARFLALAENSGLIIGIGREVLRQACEQLHDWLAEDARRSFAVNVSAVQLAQATFAEDVQNVLAAYDVRPAQLVLEVTETLFLDAAPRLIEGLAELRTLGVRVSIDDFGTGYSSLGRLQALPVDSLKIDRSFVKLIETGDEDLPILTSMVLMAHALGLDVTAEGVETPQQAERLIALGCDYLQGYHFSRPQQVRTALTSASTEALVKLGAITGDSIPNPVLLLIEDSSTIRAFVRLTLTPMGFDVEEAVTGAEGLALAHQLHPDCVLVDLGLPDTNGIDVVRELRSIPELASTTIVVLTGAAERKLKAAAFAAGADDYIVKPIAPQHLSARLRGAMRGARRTPPAATRPSGNT